MSRRGEGTVCRTAVCRKVKTLTSHAGQDHSFRDLYTRSTIILRSHVSHLRAINLQSRIRTTVAVQLYHDPGVPSANSMCRCRCRCRCLWRWQCRCWYKSWYKSVYKASSLEVNTCLIHLADAYNLLHHTVCTSSKPFCAHPPQSAPSVARTQPASQKAPMPLSCSVSATSLIRLMRSRSPVLSTSRTGCNSRPFQ